MSTIGLKHGAGGPSMRRLIREVFIDPDDRVPGGIGPAALDDGAALPHGEGFLVMATDSHVVSPRFFPGGDIGRLSVSGTVNDLAVMGAVDAPLLTLAVIVEEGFSLDELRQIRDSIRTACSEAGARVVTGDTKVMGRGEVDGLVLNTTGVAFAERAWPKRDLQPGHELVVSGPVGDHGLTVLAARERLALQGELRSDAAPVNGLVRLAMQALGSDLVTMTDPTRGGLSAALHELAEAAGVGVLLDGPAVPITAAAAAAGELLGIDPLTMANEGKVVFAVQAGCGERLVRVLAEHPQGRGAALIARCVDTRPGSVILETGFGRRLLTEPDGEIAPRIC